MDVTSSTSILLPILLEIPDPPCYFTQDPPPALQTTLCTHYLSPYLPPLAKLTNQHSSHPNTPIHYPLFTPHNLPMPQTLLKLEGWENLTSRYPDRRVVNTILGICEYGARIGYQGHWYSVTIHPNLSRAEEDPSLVMAEILAELQRARLETYPNSICLPKHYRATPLGLTDKSDGSKRRIHHLSYPAGDPSAINNSIPEDYGAIAY